jgi:hypothetical protein
MDEDIPSLFSCSEAPVVLYAPRKNESDIKARVHLSRGTCLARTIDNGAPFYSNGARAPVPDWRLPTPEENSVLWSTAAPPAHRGVGVVRLLGPESVRLFGERCDIFERAADEDTLRHPMVSLLLDVIGKAGLIIKHVISARIGRDEPGRITMTMYRDARIGLHRVGLHLDCWDRCALNELARSTNRVSINLGPTDRYFIFLNQTAGSMSTILKRGGVSMESDQRVIGKSFMSAFPNYPVVRVRLRPGEAYIAPTENILHDGSSAEVRNVNHYLSVRGRFDFVEV